MTNLLQRAAGLTLLSLVLVACGKSEAPPAATSSATAPAAPITPADPELAKIYTASCRLCHGAVGNPAPQAGDTAAWAPRLAQGMPTLLQHTVAGFKGMPPLGSCSDCGEAEFTALIEFMATGQGAAP
ncbi:MAG TPA: c-type cytochrome [Nevskiaceae bacterium]|nr:c-type cytochrome [Nevskiaceae bacterium]